ncbi:MAG: PDZ domain-containing protein [Phycisphaerae bacterium]
MKRSMVLVLAAALAVGASLAACGCGDATSMSTRTSDLAVKSVYPALVRIHVVVGQPSEGRMRKLQASGSGAIISPEGYVITNHHVAGRSQYVICRMADRQEIEATLVGTDPMTDIAIIKLKLDQRRDKSAPVPVAAFGDSDALRVGDTVLAMGSPAGLSQSVTEGIVSNAEMILPYGSLEMEGEAVGTLVRWIGHSAPIYPGSSGGPLVNLKGQIVGVNEIGVGGLGGAIPGNLARSIADQIIASSKSEGQAKVSRSWAGMECQPMLRSSTLRGVLVAGVLPDSPASKSGLATGDIITEFDGQKVSVSVPEELPLFNQLVLSRPIGKTVKIVVLRAGKPMGFDLTVAARDPARGEYEELKDWGMTARDLTTFSAMEMQRAREGVIVQTVRPGGQVGDAKPAIVPGDVIVEVGGKKVKDLAELEKVTKEITATSSNPVETLVAFERGVRKYLTVVKVGKPPQQQEAARAKKAWIGVTTQVLTRDLAKALKLEGKAGVRVTQVLPKTTAEAAGLKVGDVLLTLDDDAIKAQQVEDEEVFPNMVRQRSIDQEVVLGIVRDGKADKVKVKLETPPAPASEMKVYKDDDFEFTAREVSAFDRNDKKLSEKVQGVLIEKVEPAGWASLGGLSMGDVLMAVDGKATADVAKLQETLAAAKKNKAKRIVFLVKRGVHTLFLELTAEWK